MLLLWKDAHSCDEMLQGDSGLLAGLSEGKIWIDHSTTDYEQVGFYNSIIKEFKNSTKF